MFSFQLMYEAFLSQSQFMKHPLLPQNMENWNAITISDLNKTEFIKNNNSLKANENLVYTIILIEEAEGSIMIDYNSYQLQANQLFIIQPYQSKYLNLDSKAKGKILSFSKLFLLENDIPETLISDIHLFKAFGDNPPLKLNDKSFSKLSQIIAELKNVIPYQSQLSGHTIETLLNLFLNMCYNLDSSDCKKIDEENQALWIYKGFKDLIEQNFNDWHDLDLYAESMNLNPEQISLNVKSISGYTAGQLLQSRINLQAKKLLMETQLNLDEISQKLGYQVLQKFDENFKTQVGLSPQEFRADFHDSEN